MIEGATALLNSDARQFNDRGMDMLEAIVAILAGLLLLADLFRGAGQRMIGALRPFEVVIGVIALVGMLHIGSVFDIALLFAGFVLAVSALESVPRIGNELARAGRALHVIAHSYLRLSRKDLSSEFARRNTAAK